MRGQPGDRGFKGPQGSYGNPGLPGPVGQSGDNGLPGYKGLLLFKYQIGFIYM